MVRTRLVAVAFLAALAGCTKILGLDYNYEPTGTGTGAHDGGTTTTSGTGGSDGGACGSFVWDPEDQCQSCMEGSCCAELRACDTGTPCAIVAACGRACKAGDDACLTTCINADSNMHGGSGLSAYDALLQCFGDHCDNTNYCTFPVCKSTYSWPSRACADCLGNDPGCCATLTACGNDPVCEACISNPNSMGCSANTNFQKAYVCETQTCGIECSYAVCNSPIWYTSYYCNYCVSQATGGCCTQFNACVQDMNSVCYACMYNISTTGCATDMLYTAYNDCVSANCSVQCAGF